MEDLERLSRAGPFAGIDCIGWWIPAVFVVCGNVWLSIRYGSHMMIDR